jgi:hypothetical protein
VDGMESMLDMHGFPEGVRIREVMTGRRRSKFIHCDDLPTMRIASALPGKSLIVWLLIGHRARTKGVRWVTLPQSMLSDWGITRSAKCRALNALHGAGLIEINQSAGCSTRVGLADPEQIPGNTSMAA